LFTIKVPTFAKPAAGGLLRYVARVARQSIVHTLATAKYVMINGTSHGEWLLLQTNGPGRTLLQLLGRCEYRINVHELDGPTYSEPDNSYAKSI